MTTGIAETLEIPVDLTSHSYASKLQDSLCDKCQSKVCIWKSLVFLESQNELLNDQVIELQKLNLKYRQEVNKLQQENKGTMWMIKEKDTEIRLITKEKDQLHEKILENRLEQIQAKDDKLKIKDLQNQIQSLKRLLQTENGKNDQQWQSFQQEPLRNFNSPRMTIDVSA